MYTVGTKFNFQKLEPTEREEALVLTHPYHGVNRQSDPYLEFIEENKDVFDFYFVGGIRPIEHKGSYENASRVTVNFPRVDLPSGYTEGLYEGVIKESDTGYGGNIEEDEADDLLLDYSRVLVGGENLFMCQRRTYNDLLRRKDELGVDTHIGVLSEASFAPAAGLDDNKSMYSLENIEKHDLPLLNDEFLEAEFKEETVNAYRI